MTTSELCDLLMKLDPTGNLEVLETRCSDYREMSEESWGIAACARSPADFARVR